MATTLNRARFIKIIALAESTNGAEALAAIRKATALARAAGLSLGEAVQGNSSSDDQGRSNLFAYDQGRESGFAAGVKTGHAEAEATMNHGNDGSRFEEGFMAATAAGLENEPSTWHAGHRNWTV
jgi:hypothetical protein